MKIADISIRNPVFAAVINLVLIIAGVVALPRVGVDLFPNVDIPIVTVTTVYPGADPGSVEAKVSEPLEEALNTLSGLKSLRSTSMENASVVVLEFELEVDADQAATDAQNKVSSVLGELPADLDPPVVAKFDVGAAPILSLALAGDLPLTELTHLADDVVKARLQRIPGVGSVDVVGGQAREIEVRVRRDQLARYGLTVADLRQVIAAQNLEVPGGRLEVEGVEFTVKTRGEVSSVQALRDIVLMDLGQRPLTLGEVAEVVDGAEEARSASNLDGVSAVSLVIIKQSGANTVEVAHRVRAALDELATRLPAGVTLHTPIDNSVFIEASINDVRFDLLFGAILAVLIILVFLRDWRATLISAIALPTSVLATVAFINLMGFSFNNMTMLALTLSIGILIDDAIVVIENIHRHLSLGKSPTRAASEGTAEIGLAVMAITAAIVAVFLPVAVMKGIIGRFFFQFGMTVAFAVAVSMFTSLTLTPMLSSKLLKDDHGKTPGLISRAVGAVLDLMDRMYRSTLRGALRFRFLTLLAAGGVFMGSLALATKIPAEFMPPEDRGEYKVAFELPQGTPLDETVRFANTLRDDMARQPGVTLTMVTIGAGTRGTVNKGELHVELVPRGERAFTTLEAMAHARKIIGDRAPAKVAVEAIQAIGGGGQASQVVQFALRGTDQAQLDATATALAEKLRGIKGFVDVDTTVAQPKPELNIVIDREAAADVQAPVATIAMTIRTLINGEKVSEVPLDGERVDVRLRQHPDERQTLDDVRGIQVRSGDRSLVDLRSLVHIDRGTGPAEIERQAQARQVVVLANLDGLAQGTALDIVAREAKQLVPAGVDTALLGRSQIMRESMGYMVEAVMLAMVLVFLILAAQFNSWLHPFTIMMSLPLTTIGAFGALYLFGHNLSMFAMIGFIMLIGLVTKNAVLLVDYTNTLKARGTAVREAIVEAGVVRLRPILMTTAAMVFGMLPVALAKSLGGEQRAPMAITVMGGLVASTVLTLVVVPVIYSVVEQVRGFFARKLGGAVEPAEAHA
ncbi:MAG: efflux RND transporter permease subunit [Myxococcales bacterium]|nr:efflux RND transporter permease subunit [Myxococcales bacterium]MCB9526317.1 efflux RND transporter permease subunit [Myxococcales bacterium]